MSAQKATEPLLLTGSLMARLFTVPSPGINSSWRMMLLGLLAVNPVMTEFVSGSKLNLSCEVKEAQLAGGVRALEDDERLVRVLV